MSEPTVKPLTWPTLLLALVCGVAVTVVATSVLEESLGGVPAPYGTALLLAAMALVTWLMARAARRRLATDRSSVESREAIGWLGIARAGLVASAFCVGLNGAWALMSVPRWSAPLPQARVIHGGLATVGSLLWGWAAWRLQDALKLPPADDNPTQDADLSEPPRA